MSITLATETKNIPKTTNSASKDQTQTKNSKKDVSNKQKNISNKLLNQVKKTQRKYNFKSLMFSQKEINDLYNNMNSTHNKEKKKKKKEEKPKEIAAFGKVYLSSILYLSKDRWSVWINNNKISSMDNIPTNDLYIKSITPYEIDLIWQLRPRKWRIISELPFNIKTPPLNKNGQIEINIQLRSNQTYILKSEKIIDGKI